MPYGKRIIRRIVRVDISPERTTKGKPKWYRFTLECGHTRTTHHTPSAFITACVFKDMVKEGTTPNFKKQCRECARGKPQSPKCDKTKLPLSVVTLNTCHDKCPPEQLSLCHKAYLKWIKEMKP